MSQPKDPWDDTGFEPGDNDDSFQASPKQAPKRLEVDATKPEPLPVTPPVSAATQAPPSRAVPPAKERKRGALYWIAGIAGVLFVCALGGFAIWFMFGERTAEDELIYSDEPVPAEVPAPMQDTALAALDTMSLENDSVLAAIEEPPAAEPVPEVNAPASATPSPRSTASSRPAEKPSAETKPMTQPKSITQPKQIAQPPAVKPTQLQEKPVPPPTTAKPSAQNLGGTSSLKTAQPTKTAATPMYVVQVFSSPSRDDADEWLQSLREKKIPNGYIVEQPIKGRPWYRVRFGEFATRQEAEAAAMKHGITQPWIARVR